jgi:hypothetical protein
MLSDADLPAHIEYRASRAFGQGAGANVLAERYQQFVDLYPVFAWQSFFKFEGTRFGCLGCNIAPAIGDAP